jgi:hypothetical protein
MLRKTVLPIQAMSVRMARMSSQEVALDVTFPPTICEWSTDDR